MSRAAIREALAGWNGRSKAEPERAFHNFRETEGFREHLTSLAQEADCADAATWCLKRWQETGRDPGPLAPIVEAANAAPGWPAKLHVLQILDASDAPVPESALTRLILATTKSDRPMLRAWGYAAADRLGHAHPTSTVAMRAMLEKASETETAPSVLARLKRCSL